MIEQCDIYNLSLFRITTFKKDIKWTKERRKKKKKRPQIHIKTSIKTPPVSLERFQQKKIQQY